MSGARTWISDGARQNHHDGLKKSSIVHSEKAAHRHRRRLEDCAKPSDVDRRRVDRMGENKPSRRRRSSSGATHEPPTSTRPRSRGPSPSLGRATLTPVVDSRPASPPRQVRQSTSSARPRQHACAPKVAQGHVGAAASSTRAADREPLVVSGALNLEHRGRPADQCDDRSDAKGRPRQRSLVEHEPGTSQQVERISNRRQAYVRCGRGGFVGQSFVDRQRSGTPVARWSRGGPRLPMAPAPPHDARAHRDRCPAPGSARRRRPGASSRRPSCSAGSPRCRRRRARGDSACSRVVAADVVTRPRAETRRCPGDRAWPTEIIDPRHDLIVGRASLGCAPFGGRGAVHAPPPTRGLGRAPRERQLRRRTGEVKSPHAVACASS